MGRCTTWRPPASSPGGGASLVPATRQTDHVSVTACSRRSPCRPISDSTNGRLAGARRARRLLYRRRQLPARDHRNDDRRKRPAERVADGSVLGQSVRPDRQRYRDGHRRRRRDRHHERDADGGPCGDERETAPASGVLYGYYGGDTYTYETRTTEPCRATFTLEGPDNADFDPVSHVGRAHPDDRRLRRPVGGSRSRRGDRARSDRPSTSIGVLIEPASGYGRYTIGVEELGR